MVSYTSTINRLRTELARLQNNDATLMKKEADLQTKINRARDSASRSKVASTITAKLKEIERASHDLANVAKQRSTLSSKIAAKSKDLTSYVDRQNKEDEKSRAKIAAEQRKLISDQVNHERKLSAALKRAADTSTDSEQLTYDFFISHASEDKNEIVRDLANELTELGAAVFYDESTLKVGDSLRRNIDRGLANSRFGVVVLSEAFFRKEWPARELDGLTAMEVQGQTRILPIWHKVSKDEVARYSPVLADKVALNTSLKSAREIATELHSLL